MLFYVLAMTLTSLGVFAQNNITVKGTVISSSGEKLPGVSIALQNSSKGSTTDQDGKFSIEADGKGTLVFSFVGFQTQTVSINGRTQISVSLTETDRTLDEIVVVGYGQQTRKSLTSSISTITAKDLNRGAISDPTQLLQGKVAGLNITKSGDPNGRPSIILRGASTLREGDASQPLFVIDGVVGADLATVAPDDIMAMDVLKDAAATSIYGSRAANGVIIITTNRPKDGQTFASYKSYIASETVSNTIDMMSGDQLRSYLTKNGKSLGPADDTGANTNWQDVVAQRGFSQNHNVSFGGGNKSTNYNASINYFKQDGIIKSSSLDRLIGRLSIEQYALNDKLKMGLTLATTQSNSGIVPFQDVLLINRLRYLPTVSPFNTDGTYYENLARSNYYNPSGIIDNATVTSNSKTFLANFRATLKLPAGFSYDVSATVQNNQTNGTQFYNDYYTTNYNNIAFTTNYTVIGGRNGLAVRNTYENTNTLFENYITYNKAFGKHNVNVIAGYSWQQTLNGDGFQANNTNFPTNDTQANFLGLGNSQAVSGFVVDYGGNNYSKLRLISDYARLNYSYAGKYFIQGSVRRDGSSAFGANNRWGYFPSVSAAWGIDGENFMKNQNVFSELKMRLSYGQTGNSLGFNPLVSLLRYGNVGTFLVNGATLSAIGVVQNPNPDLRWEKTAMSNIGLDFGILKNKITGTLDLYSKTTTDLIWTYDVDPSVYLFRQLTANAGEMSNKGIELTLNYTPVKTQNFTWTTSINMAHNRNILVSLKGEGLQADSLLIAAPNGGGQTGSTVQVLLSGQPVGQFYTFQYAGRNEAGVSQFTSSKGGTTLVPLNKNDYFLAGNAQPKLLLGWNNTIAYKQFDLNFFFRAVLGHQIMNTVRADFNRPQEAGSYNVLVETGDEPIGDFNSFRYSDRYIESGSFLRLDNATLGYTVKTKKNYIKNLRFYLSGNNIFVLTKYKGIDPEVNMGGLTPGVDWTRFGNGFYPKTRTFMFGVNVGF
ncbi:MAG: SusC/RagA family TonB-linked outer membrane protein [Arcicella sp.]|nr:SusC/RagA family TonB-linked outer membrane protein [Arcicella sp.]